MIPYDGMGPSESPKTPVVTRPDAPDQGADDAALIARLRAGEDAAFETVVRLYYGRLFAIARRMLTDEEDAKDAVQDALLSAARGIQGFEGGARLSTWLHRIVVNASLMKLRSRTRRRRQERPISELLPTFLEDGHQAEPAAMWSEGEGVSLERSETRQLVRRCIDELPESYRAVLILRDIEGFDTDETARLLDLSSAAVKTRLHRARQALRELLDPHMRAALEGGRA